MKRAFIISAALAVLISLCACGEAAPEAAVETVPVPAATASPYEGISLDTASSAAMCSFMGGNRALIEGDSLYCFDFSEDYSPVLAEYGLSSRLTVRKVLAEGFVPEHLAERENTLYYINDGAVECIGTDGANRRVLIADANADSLQLYGEDIYLLCGSSLVCNSGGQSRTLLENCCYPYIFDGLIIYQSESDGESLHLCRLDGADDAKLTGLPSYAPVIFGNTVFYTQASEGGMVLCSVALTGGEVTVYDAPVFSGEAEFYIESGILFARIMAEDGQFTAEYPFSNGEYARDGQYVRMDFCSDAARIDTHYEPNARIKSFEYICGGDTVSYLAGLCE